MHAGCEKAPASNASSSGAGLENKAGEPGSAGNHHFSAACSVVPIAINKDEGFSP
jgi:hypothetical protein